MEPKILAVSAVSPEHRSSTEEILPHLERWLAGRGGPDAVEQVRRIVRSVRIDRRASALPLAETFEERTFEAKNDSYIECAVELASRALAAGLEAAEVDAGEIDFLITTSCTGFMIPSLDAHLANRHRMRSDLRRLPVLQMGCAGGTAGLIYADDYLRAHPGGRVAVVACELPSVTLQLGDVTMANIVSAALFADGAACAVLGPTGRVRPAIVDTRMVHIPDTAGIMGYRLTDSGLRIVLGREIPDVIAANLRPIIEPFLARNGLAIGEIDHMVFHPGSVKILERTEELLAPLGKHVEESKAVLRANGNLSSATVLFILERFLARGLPAGDRGLMLSFGPGFTGHALLLEWR